MQREHNQRVRKNANRLSTGVICVPNNINSSTTFSSVLAPFVHLLQPACLLSGHAFASVHRSTDHTLPSLAAASLLSVPVVYVCVSRQQSATIDR
jgi:hypothetical protein